MKFASTPAYTIQGKSSQDHLISNQVSPGPCAYTVSPELFSSNTAYTFSQSLRPNLFKQIQSPGPGDYLIASPSPKIAKRKKSPLSPPIKDKTRQVLPGPGFYNPKPQFHSPQFTIPNRIPETAPKPEAVGPGTYFPVKPSLQVSRSTVFSKSCRFNELKNNCPGPGAYENIQAKIVVSKFAQASRDLKHSDSSPGPGSYEVSTLNSVGKTIAGRNFANSRKDISPGPGAYNFSINPKDSSPVYSIGKAEKLKNDKSESGPGFVYLGSTFNSSGKSFPKAKRNDLINKNQVPGPGAFDIPSTFGEGPKISINERRGKYVISEVPGPAYYSPVKPDNNLASTFAKQPRWKEKINELPGPGNYDLPKYKIPGFTFKKDLNIKEDSDEEPGPGHYQIPPSIPDIPSYYATKEKPNKLTH